MELKRKAQTVEQELAQRELRRGRFPWLTSGKRSARSWDRLPTAVMQKILRMLPDDTLFDLRVLSSDFYEAYYAQDVPRSAAIDVTGYNFEFDQCPFNFERAMRLARRGR